MSTWHFFHRNDVRVVSSYHCQVDVHIMEQPSGEWQYIGTDLTDGHGRLTFTLPKEKRQTQGMHSVKMVVRYCNFIELLYL